jgi:hypothetical protein
MNTAKSKTVPFPLIRKPTKKVKRGNIQDYFNRSPNKKSFYNVMKPSANIKEEDKEDPDQKASLEFDIFDLLKTKNESNSNIQEEFTDLSKDKFLVLGEQMHHFHHLMKILMPNKIKILSRRPLHELVRKSQTFSSLQTYSFISNKTNIKLFAKNLESLASVFDQFSIQNNEATFVIRIQQLEFIFSNNGQILDNIRNCESVLSDKKASLELKKDPQSLDWFCFVSWKKKIENVKKNKEDGITIDVLGKVVENEETSTENTIAFKSILLSKIFKKIKTYEKVSLNRKDILSDDYSPFETFRNEKNMSDNGIIFKEKQLVLVFQMILSHFETTRNINFSILSDFYFNSCTVNTLTISKNKKAFISDSAPNNFQSFQEKRTEQTNVIEQVVVSNKEWSRVNGENGDLESVVDCLQVHQNPYFLELQGNVFGKVASQLIYYATIDKGPVLIMFE